MPDPVKRKLLLVGWDSADWKIIQPLIDSGAMPGIQRSVKVASRSAATNVSYGAFEANTRLNAAPWGCLAGR